MIFDVSADFKDGGSFVGRWIVVANGEEEVRQKISNIVDLDYVTINVVCISKGDVARFNA